MREVPGEVAAELLQERAVLGILGGRDQLLVEHADDLVVLAHSDEDPSEIHAMRHREHPVWGVQFHPESIMTPHGLRLLENFLELAS